MSITELLDRRRSCLLVVDVQERLLPVIHENELLLQNIRRLVSGADILGLPIIVSEQYPKGLGPTVAPLAEILEQARRLEKITFSCMRDQSIADMIRETSRDSILVCGIESHVCVLQTVLDALCRGFRVHVAADAVSSRTPENKWIALERMREAGAVITSTESALFELLEKAGTREFKKISALVK